MTPDGAFDRHLTTWLEQDAAPRAPHGFDSAVTESVNQQHQLPSWATPERWMSMETRAQLGGLPRLAIALLTLTLLAIGAMGGFAIGGAIVDASEAREATVSNGPIAFTNEDGGIWAADRSGDAVLLTEVGELGGGMEWSLDGTRFSYESHTGEDEPATMMIRDADGSDPVVVSEPLGGVWGHAWSPDGGTLLFAASAIDAAETLDCADDADFCGLRIYSVPTDGSALAQPIGDPGIAAINPIWTPDGAWIIFAGSTDEGLSDRHLYRMAPDGSDVQVISDLTGKHAFTFQHFDISPDGTSLATQAGDVSSDIYLVDLESGEAELLASEFVDEFEARWSPDGTHLVLNYSVPAYWDPGSRLIDMASRETRDLDPSLRVQGWAPDGGAVYGQYEEQIGILDPFDDSAEVEIVPGSASSDPGWRPIRS